jgi:hypothetical protein
MPKPIKDYVKEHLHKRNVDPATLTDGVIDALNAFSPEELAKVDNLGAALMSAPIQPDQKISAVH